MRLLLFFIRIKWNRIKQRLVFEKTVADWFSELVDSLSVVCGYACTKEYPGKIITELANIADKRMYEAKAAYYKKEKTIEEKTFNIQH